MAALLQGCGRALNDRRRRSAGRAGRALSVTSRAVRSLQVRSGRGRPPHCSQTLLPCLPISWAPVRPFPEAGDSGLGKGGPAGHECGSGARSGPAPMSLQGRAPGRWQLKHVRFVLGAISSGFPVSLKVQRTRTASAGLGDPLLREVVGTGSREGRGRSLRCHGALPAGASLPVCSLGPHTVVPCVCVLTASSKDSRQTGSRPPDLILSLSSLQKP